jgi:hypothetical protein
LASFWLDVPDVAVSLRSLCVHHRHSCEHQPCEPRRKQNHLWSEGFKSAKCLTHYMGS